MIFQIRHTFLFVLFFLFSIVLPDMSYGFRTDIELTQQWEKRQKNKAQAPFLLGGAWDKLKEVSTSKYAAAGANSGGVIEEVGDTFTNISTKRLKQALRETGTKGRDINKAVKPLRKSVKAAGGVLKKIGKVASLGDEAGNVGGFAGAMQGGDLVGAGEVVVNRSLAGASATAGGFGGGKIALAGAILLGLNPPAALAVGAIGTVGGAVATSVAYDEYGKPIVSKAADDIEEKRSDWEAKEKNRLGRIRADIHIVGLDEPPDPSISSAGRTSSTDAPVEDDLLRASNISDVDAKVLRKKAKEKLAKRQAEKKDEVETEKKEDTWWEKFGKQEQAKKKAEAEKKKLEEAKKKAEAEKKKKEKEEAKKNAEARKKAEAQKKHEENLRKLAGVVRSGDLGKIKSQIRASIDSAVTPQDRSRLKGIVQDIKDILKQEARANQAAMSNAIQRGQAAQQRTAQQRRALAESIIGFVNQAQSVSGGGGDGGSSRDGSGLGSSPGGSIGGSGGGSDSAICEQLRQQLEQMQRQVNLAIQNKNWDQSRILGKKGRDLMRRSENAGCK